MATVLDDLLAALVARLEQDTVFSDPESGVRAVPENSMDLLAEVDNSLAKLGLALVVAITGVVPAEQGAYQGSVMITVSAQAHEIVPINRAREESESKLTGLQLLMLAKALWDRPWSPDPDVFSTVYFARLDMTEVDQEHARVIWTLEMQVFTILQTDHESDRITEESADRVTEETSDRATE